MANKHPFDLIVCDLDGTLVDRDLVINSRAIELISHLRSEGVQTTFATGRTLNAAQRYMQQVGVQLPVILYNGSVILDPVSGDVLHESRIPKGQVQRALVLMKEFAVDPQLYLDPSDEGFYVERMTWSVEAFMSKDGIEATIVGDFREFLQRDPLKLLLIGPRPELVRLRNLIAAAELEMETVLSEDNYLELLPPSVSKGSALINLCQHLDISLDRVVAFGDNPNDAELLRTAGLGVAMSSGAPELLECADKVFDSVAEGLADLF